MNQHSQIPNLDVRERSSAKMREISMMFDAQILVLDELITKVESQNSHNSVNTYRQERGKRLFASLQQETEN